MKCLPYKSEDLSLIPRSHVKKNLDVVARVCNHSPGEEETDAWSSLASLPHLFDESQQVSERPYLKKLNVESTCGTSGEIDLWLLDTCTCVHTSFYLCIQVSAHTYTPHNILAYT